MNLKMCLTAALGFANSTLVEAKERSLDSLAAISALGALAQEHRLAVFRMLVQAGENGLPAGEIAEALGVPNSSLSFHLAQLHRSGLIKQERRHRSLIYSANYAVMNALVAYLMENCCAGADCSSDAALQQQATPKRKSA